MARPCPFRVAWVLAKPDPVSEQRSFSEVSIGNGLAGGLDTYLGLAMWSLGKPLRLSTFAERPISIGKSPNSLLSCRWQDHCGAIPLKTLGSSHCDTKPPEPGGFVTRSGACPAR